MVCVKRRQARSSLILINATENVNSVTTFRHQDHSHPHHLQSRPPPPPHQQQPHVSPAVAAHPSVSTRGRSTSASCGRASSAASCAGRSRRILFIARQLHGTLHRGGAVGSTVRDCRLCSKSWSPREIDQAYRRVTSSKCSRKDQRRVTCKPWNDECRSATSVASVCPCVRNAIVRPRGYSAFVNSATA